MAKKSERIALIEDARLSDTAVRLGCWMEAKAVDWTEVSTDQFALILNGFPSPDTIRRAVRQLELSGWVERRKGGRGHADSFRFTPASVPSLKRDKTPDRPAPMPSLNSDRLESPAGVTVTPASVPSLNSPDTYARDHASRVRSPSPSEVEEEPPIVPLGDRAERALWQHGDRLKGCRGALRDYVAAFVETRRQYSYIQTIATWLDDGDPGVWLRPDGSRLPPEERNALLAAALNELAAGDEAKMKRPVGDPGNLRTKINILLKPRRHGYRATGTDGGRADGEVGGGEGPASLYPG